VHFDDLSENVMIGSDRAEFENGIVRHRRVETDVDRWIRSKRWPVKSMHARFTIES
jgi:hypothetical protein